MTSDDSGLRTISTVVAVLLAVPLFMMGVVMPLLGLTGLGKMPFGLGGWGMLMPVVPLVVFGGVAYVLYVGAGDDSGREVYSALEELRSAYARGELSDAEFENRRSRLQSHVDAAAPSEVESDE